MQIFNKFDKCLSYRSLDAHVCNININISNRIYVSQCKVVTSDTVA